VATLSKNPQYGLTDKDFDLAAETLGCEVNAIKAVAIVESGGKDFFIDVEGEKLPVILWERHKFYKYSSGPYSKTHPHLSNKTPGGYSTKLNEWKKFKEAYALEPEAAILSASFGAFQIMGFNHIRVGYPKVEDFFEAMKRSAKDHLSAFVQFIKTDPRLLEAIRTKNWKRFAYLYNGPEFWKNEYDKKMASAYKTLSAPQNPS
jgi:hypothetical protein